MDRNNLYSQNDLNGGKCLPKDVKELKSNLVYLAKATYESNKKRKQYILKSVNNTNKVGDRYE